MILAACDVETLLYCDRRSNSETRELNCSEREANLCACRCDGKTEYDYLYDFLIHNRTVYSSASSQYRMSFLKSHARGEQRTKDNSKILRSNFHWGHSRLGMEIVLHAQVSPLAVLVQDSFQFRKNIASVRQRERQGAGVVETFLFGVLPYSFYTCC